MQGLDIFFFLWAASLIFFMKAGFIALEIGQFSHKNAAYHCLLKLLDLAAVFIGYLFIGYGIAYGFNYIVPLITGNFDAELGAWFMKMVMFAAAAVTIITGGVAERIKILPYFLGALIVGSILYPIVEHLVWGGGFQSLGINFHDYAGSGAVHLFGGLVGLVAAYFLGPRIKKYINGVPQALPGHNIPLAVLGAFILAFGWYGFNIGSAASVGDGLELTRVAIATTMALAGGIIGGALSSKNDPLYTANGMCAGLVAVCSGVDLFTPIGALIVGFLAGFQQPFTYKFIEEKLKIDDVCAIGPVHAMSGLIGVICAGIPFLLREQATSLVGQIIGAVVIGLIAIVGGVIIYKGLDIIIGLRVPKEVEETGLDEGILKVSAYTND
ncbi:ammonium transporter [Methanocaldococcus infernus ME]|uniref:Ammonium transporter n=1 Tax=Methanocaldococcus infernus (strain DSM 11812 / JCM 15783 / ME) TaxID=573063 RepID=D5VQF9_METIM|nr:ammonium transporter [Methanocaldococcus infernus]ADG12812.1 ammonium transporter [Methanocaldococcus infernus ME]